MDGERIRRVRLALDLTQAELGARMGVTGGRIGRWERGEPSPIMLPLALDALLAQAGLVATGGENDDRRRIRHKRSGSLTSSEVALPIEAFGLIPEAGAMLAAATPLLPTIRKIEKRLEQRLADLGQNVEARFEGMTGDKLRMSLLSESKNADMASMLAMSHPAKPT